MPAPNRAVVFDLDGLMFDTEALFFRVSSDMLAARGKMCSPEIMRAMIGRRSVDAGHVLKTMTGLDEPRRRVARRRPATVLLDDPAILNLLEHAN
jgi:beta-phosphoglucomutase-like phosphatase (HAD superfamily)